jgi:hypothetical protein
MRSAEVCTNDVPRQEHVARFVVLQGCVHACVHRYTSVAQRWPKADKGMSRQDHVACSLCRDRIWMHGLSPKGITGLFVVLRRCMG